MVRTAPDGRKSVLAHCVIIGTFLVDLYLIIYLLLFSSVVLLQVCPWELSVPRNRMVAAGRSEIGRGSRGENHDFFIGEGGSAAQISVLVGLNWSHGT